MNADSPTSSNLEIVEALKATAERKEGTAYE